MIDGFDFIYLDKITKTQKMLNTLKNVNIIKE